MLFDSVSILLCNRKGYKESKINDELEPVVKREHEHKSKSLNAFDIISFSSGLNLTPLFDGTSSSPSPGQGERVVVAESPENVINKVEEIVKEANARIKKRKEFGVELVGQNGKFIIELEVYRLTEKLVVVEVQSNGEETEFYDDLWKNKIRSELLERREVHVAET